MTGPRSHHADLRATFLDEARSLLEEGGVEALSLRALAQRLEVTAPSLYHHFRDKNDLLCAIAEVGFRDLDEAVTPRPEWASAPLEERLHRFVASYVGFAIEHPQVYDLLFGRAIWKLGTPTPAMRRVAFHTFRKFVEHVTDEVERAGLSEGTDVLRVAQGTWAMLHGLCRQQIDGIYTDGGDLDAMTAEVARFLLGRLMLRSAPLREPDPPRNDHQGGKKRARKDETS